MPGKFLLVLPCALLLTLHLQGAHATVVTAGQTASLGAPSPAPTGTLLQSVTYPLGAEVLLPGGGIGLLSTPIGTFTNDVWRNPDGTLDFGFSVTALNRSQNLTLLDLHSYGNPVDVRYVAGGALAPTSAFLDDAYVLQVAFPSAAPGAFNLAEGQSTALIVIHTEAKSFTSTPAFMDVTLSDATILGGPGSPFGLHSAVYPFGSDPFGA